MPDHHHDHAHDRLTMTTSMTHEHDHAHDHDHAFGWVDGLRLIVVLICAVGAWFAEAYFFAPDGAWSGVSIFFRQFDPWPYLAVIDFLPQALVAILPAPVTAWIDYWLTVPFSTYGAIGLVFGGLPIFREAFHNLLERRMTMELSMTIALLAAAYIGFFFTALIITFFVLVAETLEGMTIERGRRAIRDLLEFLPRRVTVRRDDGMREVDTDELSPGEVVVVAPGSRIPVDGAVVAGHSFVDESRITGESMPVEKVPGAEAFAGSINQSGALEIRAERIGADTSYGKIIEVVERAERSRAPITRLADRLAGYIVIFAMATAAVAHYFYPDVNTTISVLIVAGACGVAAGTPLAILGAIGRSARLGAIVKGGVHLETLGRVDTVVLDKTGTLTFGTPSIRYVRPAPGVPEAEVIAAAGSAELLSEHPLGKAIVARARADGTVLAEPETFAYTPGRGIAALVEGGRIAVGSRAWMEESGVAVVELGAPADGAASQIFVARDGRLLGVIGVADTIRPEARGAVDALLHKGIRVLLLTGDSESVAAAVARDLGISEVEAELLPEDKLARIGALIGEGRVVAMVGDGINDAPALTAAHVGVAMGSGTDVARESADIVLLGNDLARFVDTLALARRTRRIIWQNFAGTIIVDLAGIGLALMGLIGPVIAAQIHTGSELLFILNAARLLPSWSPFGPRLTAAATPSPSPEPISLSRRIERPDEAELPVDAYEGATRLPGRVRM